MRVAGVDACRAGWVAVILEQTGPASALVAAQFADILAACPDAAAIGVDMPLGLAARGWRKADRLAAARLGRRRSSLFMIPPERVWQAATHADAVRLCRELTDPPAGFSRQAWMLKAKLQQANAAYAAGSDPLIEVHPELSFAELAGGQPVPDSKKTADGQRTRRALLERAGVRLPPGPAPAGAGVDDVLDAAAAAWTARRFARGEAVSLPSPPERNEAGLVMAIWY